MNRATTVGRAATRAAPTTGVLILCQYFHMRFPYYTVEAIQFSAFFTILFEKVQRGDQAYNEMSGFGDPSYRKTAVYNPIVLIVENGKL